MDVKMDEWNSFMKTTSSTCTAAEQRLMALSRVLKHSLQNNGQRVLDCIFGPYIVVNLIAFTEALNAIIPPSSFHLSINITIHNRVNPTALYTVHLQHKDNRGFS